MHLSNVGLRRCRSTLRNQLPRKPRPSRPVAAPQSSPDPSHVRNPWSPQQPPAAFRSGVQQTPSTMSIHAPPGPVHRSSKQGSRRRTSPPARSPFRRVCPESQHKADRKGSRKMLGGVRELSVGDVRPFFSTRPPSPPGRRHKAIPLSPRCRRRVRSDQQPPPRRRRSLR